MIEVLIAEVRTLAKNIQDTSPRISRAAKDTELDQTLKGIVEHLETLPDRLSRAISVALTRHHQIVMKDVNAALQEFAIQLGHDPEV